MVASDNLLTFAGRQRFIHLNTLQCDMKTLLTFLLFLAMSLKVSSQTISYVYDNAGNRIFKGIMMTSNPLDEQQGKQKKQDSYSDLLSKKNIRIYPNPTSGILRIEVMGFAENDECTLTLYSTAGQLIERTQLTSSVGTLNISSRQNGVYLMTICLNGNESSWKIIKK